MGHVIHGRLTEEEARKMAQDINARTGKEDAARYHRAVPGKDEWCVTVDIFVPGIGEVVHDITGDKDALTWDV